MLLPRVALALALQLALPALAVGLLASMLGMAAYAVATPFADQQDSLLMLPAQMQTTITMVAGMMMKFVDSDPVGQWCIALLIILTFTQRLEAKTLLVPYHIDMSTKTLMRFLLESLTHRTITHSTDLQHPTGQSSTSLNCRYHHRVLYHFKQPGTILLRGFCIGFNLVQFDLIPPL
jgi:hypothetical protein